MAESSSAGKSELKCEAIQDLILSREVRRRDSSEASCSGATLNLEKRGRGYNRNSSRRRSKSRKGKSKSEYCNQPECWNCDKAGHFKKNCMGPRKQEWEQLCKHGDKRSV
jgi:hypothetical protein